jgi:hypothetical protein
MPKTTFPHVLKRHGFVRCKCDFYNEADAMLDVTSFEKVMCVECDTEK